MDRQTAEEILAAFRSADQAVHARDLDRIMAFYSDAYSYHGLTNADMRQVQADLFEEHHDSSGTHIFSNITRVVTGISTIAIRSDLQ